MLRSPLALGILILLASCGGGPISCGEFQAAGDAYQTEIADIQLDSLEAVGDDDSQRAMSVARAAVDRIEQFRREILAKSPDECFRAVFEEATEITAGELETWQEKRQGRNFPRDEERAIIASLSQLPYGWQSHLDELDC